MDKKIRNVKAGTLIRLYGQFHRVEKVFPYHIITSRINDYARIEQESFNIGDLVINGYGSKLPAY